MTPRWRGDGVDLRLVEHRDRLHVGRPVAQLHEEALVVLEPVRRAGHDEVQAVGVEVLEHLAGALLVVRRREDPEVGVRREPERSRCLGAPIRGCTTDVEDVQRIAAQAVAPAWRSSSESSAEESGNTERTTSSRAR